MDVWLGGKETLNFKGECEKGYKGSICTVCENDWARVGKYKCTEWLDDKFPYFILITSYIAGQFLFSLYVLRANINDAKKSEKSKSSVLLRILTNHI